MIRIGVLALTIMTSLLVIPAGATFSQELAPDLRTRQQFTNVGRFTLIFSLKDRVIIDSRREAGVFSIVNAGETTEHYREKFERPVDLASLGTNQEERQLFYSQRAVLFTLTNMLPVGDNIVAVHRIPKKYTFVRIVQVLDRNMRVVSTWADESLPSRVDYRLGVEPFAASMDGRTAGLGEQGEILVYNKNGGVNKSIVARGVFNREREPHIDPVDLQKNYHLSPETIELIRYDERRRQARIKEFMNKRDEGLRGKYVEVSEFDYSNINGLFFTPDESLNVLVGSSRLHRIDLATGQERIEDLSAVLGKAKSAEDQSIYQVVSQGFDLYLITLFRLIHLRLKDKPMLIGETMIPQHADTVGHWTVLAGEGMDSQRKYFVEYSDSAQRIIELKTE